MCTPAEVRLSSAEDNQGLSLVYVHTWSRGNSPLFTRLAPTQGGKTPLFSQCLHATNRDTLSDPWRRGRIAMHVCPKCQSDHLVKNGPATGKPTKQCKPGGTSLPIRHRAVSPL